MIGTALLRLAKKKNGFVTSMINFSTLAHLSSPDQEGVLVIYDNLQMLKPIRFLRDISFFLIGYAVNWQFVSIVQSR